MLNIFDIYVQIDASFVFLLQIINTFHHAKILSAAVFFYCKQTAGVHVLRVDVNYEMLKVFQFVFCIVVVRQQFFD